MADPTQPRKCTPPDDYFDSALALDLKTGAVKWAQPISGYDAWTVACNSPFAAATVLRLPDRITIWAAPVPTWWATS